MGEAGKDKKRRGFLSKRQKEIIYMLLQMNAEPVTVAAISEKHHCIAVVLFCCKKPEKSVK